MLINPKKFRSIALVCSLALVGLSVQAAEVWIRPDGTDNTGDGSAGNPYVRSTANSFDTLMNGTTITTNSTIHLMGGTFHTISTILVKDGWKIKGAGMNSTKVVFDTHPGTNNWTGAHNWYAVFQGGQPGLPDNTNEEVTDLTVDCNLQNQTNAMVVHAVGLSGNYSAIRRVRAINWGCTMPTNPYETFVLHISCPSTTSTSKHNVIEDCVVEQPAPTNLTGVVSAINILGGNDNSTTPGAGWITDAEIRGCYVGEITAGTGAPGSPAAIQAYTCAGGIRGIRIVDNLAVNLIGGSVGVYNDTGSVQDGVIENNLFLNVFRGIDLETSISNQIYKNISIRNNLVTLGTGGGEGIMLNGQASMPSTNILISGNNVWMHNPGETAYAVHLSRANGVMIDNNVLDTSPNPTGQYDIILDSSVQLSSFRDNRDMQGQAPSRYDGSAEEADEQIVKFRPAQGPGWYRILSSSHAAGGSVRLFTSSWNEPRTDVEFHFAGFGTIPAYAVDVGDLQLIRHQKYGQSDIGGILSEVRVGSDSNLTVFLDIHVTDVWVGSQLTNIELTIAARTDKPLLKAPTFLGNPGTAPDPNKTLALGPGLRTTGPIYAGYPQREVAGKDGIIGTAAGGIGADLSSVSANRFLVTSDVGVFSQAEITQLGIDLLRQTNAAGAQSLLQVPNIIKKTADESYSTNALHDDALLKFTMAASTKYTIRLKVFYSTAATPDFKYRVIGPSGTLVRRQIIRSIPGAVPTMLAVTNAYDSADVTLTTTGTGTSPLEGMIDEEIIVHNTAQGDFVFRWAQNTTTAGTPAIVRAGSYLQYMQVQ